MEENIDLASIKKKLKKKDRRIKKNNNLEKNPETGNKRTIFDMDFNLLRQNLNPDLLIQVEELVKNVENNFSNYKNHLKRVKTLATTEHTVKDLIYTPSKLTPEQASTLRTTLPDMDDAKEACLKDHGLIWTLNNSNQEVSNFINKIKSLGNLNLTNVTSSVRKLSTIQLILASPMLRLELDQMVSKWSNEYMKILEEKFVRGTAPKEPSEDEGSEEEQDEEENGDDMLSIRTKPLSEIDDADFTDSPEELDRFFENFRYTQTLRFGGSLKQMLALWTCEEVLEAAILIYYWLVGLIRFEQDQNNFYLTCSEVQYDSDMFESKEEFLTACCNFDDGRKHYITPVVARSVGELIWGWIEIQLDMQNKIDKAHFSLLKLKKYSAAYLLTVRKTPEDIMKNVLKIPIFRDIAKSEEKLNLKIQISKSEFKSLLLAESNFFFKRQKDFENKYYAGQEEYHMISMEEVEPKHIEYWMMANILSHTYVPLVPTIDHFSNSMMELTVDAHVRSLSSPIVSRFRTAMQECQITELSMEFEAFFKVNQEVYQQVRGYLLSEDIVAMSAIVRESVVGMWSSLKKESTSIQLIEDQDVTSALNSICRRFLTDRLEGIDKQREFYKLVSGEFWIAWTQRLDSSHLAVKRLMPILCKLAEDLDDLLKGSLKETTHFTNKTVKDMTKGESPCLVTIHQNEYCRMILNSSSSCVFYINLTKNILELFESIIMTHNATKSANNLYKLCSDALTELNRPNKDGIVLNSSVDPNDSFTCDKSGDYNKPKNLPSHWKNIRRFVPEFRAKSEKIPMTVEREIWEKLRKFIDGSYWKVQVGLVCWFAFMVEGSPYEKDVLLILEKCHMDKVKTRDAAVKIMSIISEHFKLHTEADYDTKFPEIKRVPYWVFSGSDTIFGFCDTNQTDCRTWKKDAIQNILDWVSVFPVENIAGVKLNYDLEVSMEHFLRQFNPAYTVNNLQFSERVDTTIHLPSQLIETLKIKLPRPIPRDKNYFVKKDEEGIVVISDFFSWCKSFMKFSVDGAAQGLRIGIQKMYLMPEEEARLDEELREIAERKLDPDAQKYTETERPTPTTKDLSVDVPEGSDDLEATKKLDEKLEERNNLQKEVKKIYEKYGIDSDSSKNKSLSKTLAFALGGKNLARILFWSGGDEYIPELNIHLKIEKKKIRLVANSDVVSFNKQNYMYEWMTKALPDNTKELIYTLIHPREKVKRVERLQTCFLNEKWLCPMDLKDFQNQFGPDHHRALLRCIYRRAASITDTNIQKEMEYICSSLYEEMCKGTIFFRKSTEENFDDVKKMLDPIKRQVIRKWESKAIEKKEGDDEVDYFMEDDADNVTRQSKQANDGPTKYNFFAAFDIKNGLLSGWKVTSLFGSTYNYSTNNMVNFWSLFLLGLIPTDYATQGDDTHFKTRFLIGSLLHTAFVNSIGKIAHPKKQFFSTRFTEFLKKTYDIFERDIRYQPCRLISSILYENENKISKANQKNNMKDIVDLWNMFLVRIPDKQRREYIVAKKMYPHKGLRVQFKWYTNKDGGKKYELDEIEKMLSTPEMVNSFLSGPITRPNLLFKSLENGNIELYKTYVQARMKDFLIEFQFGLKVNNWAGINSYSNNVIRRLDSSSRTNFMSDQTLRSEINRNVFEAISESLTEYTKPKILGEMIDYQMWPDAARYWDHIQENKEIIMDNIVSNLIDYLKGKDIATPFAQLMVLNNQFTKKIEMILRKASVPNRDIYNSLSGYNSRCKLTNKLFDKLMDKMENPRLLFDFATSKDLGVSVSRNVVHDEYMGTIATIISETLPLLLSTLFPLKLLNIIEEDKQKDFVKTFILFLEVELFRGRAEEFSGLLRSASLASLLNAPF